MTGMLSIRNGGAGLPDLVGEYLGKGTKTFILAFSIIVLMLVGTVFVFSPALILGDIAGDGGRISIMIWVGVIFLYYLLATLMPIDKIIGKEIVLEDYSLRALTDGEDAQSEAIVKIRVDGSNEVVTGRGVSVDVMEASIKAYINGINKYFND